LVPYTHYSVSHLRHLKQIQLVQAFTDCLDSGEYMQVKNALLVLTRVNDVYPTLRRAHESLEKRVNRLRENEEREDIKVPAPP